MTPWCLKPSNPSDHFSGKKPHGDFARPKLCDKTRRLRPSSETQSTVSINILKYQPNLLRVRVILALNRIIAGSTSENDNFTKLITRTDAIVKDAFVSLSLEFQRPMPFTLKAYYRVH